MSATRHRAAAAFTASLAALIVGALSLSEESAGTKRGEPVASCVYDPATKVATFSFAAVSPGDIILPVIARDGGEIVFSSDYNSRVACTGGTPTVTNTDRIDLASSGDVGVLMTLELDQGPLAPGATAEASGQSEIEIQSRIPDLELEIVPTDEPDQVTFGLLAGNPVANLNAAERPDDADIVFHDLEDQSGPHSFSMSVVTYNGHEHSNRGEDVYSAAGGPGVGGAFPYGVLLVGGKGKDRLTGGDGNDTLYGGEDPDRMNGGAGRDRLNALGAQRDRVDCGPDKDRAEVSKNDIAHNCEVLAHSNAFRLPARRAR